MREIPFCQWFALCTRPAAGTVSHPRLGLVPVCRDCAERMDLDLEEYPEPEPVAEDSETLLDEGLDTR